MTFEIHKTEDGLLLKKLRDFSLPEILDCGQCFRWQPVDGNNDCWQGVACDKPLCIEKVGEEDFLFHCSEEDFHNFWEDYFDLKVDYGQLKSALGSDPIMSEAMTYAPGIRVLRQDGWEALCTFIISQNNNIKRIRGIVERLCETFGEPMENGGYSFPTARRLAEATLDDLAPLRSGFRAKYLLDAAKKVADGTIDLSELTSLDYAEAQKKLRQIYGVGPKVADCALLFGFYRLDAFPMDVWMKRAMATLYPNGLPEELLPYRGIAQQYLFHYARMHPELFEED